MKENKIEKLILDLSNRWECTPQEAVDRLNSMNESEINKLINSMTKKFKNGGMIDCLRAGGSVSNCKCGQTLKAQTGEKVMFAPDPRDAKENHDPRFWGRVLPKMGYDEYNKSTKTGLIHPGYSWINENIRTTGEVTQRKYSNDDWDNSYLVVDNRINPNPNESASAYIERWKDFENKMKRAGVPEPGLASYGSGGEIIKAEGGNKVRRTDEPGYAYTLPNGIDVLTQDAVGTQPLPGSYYSIDGSSPELETQRTTLTDKGGEPVAYNYNVYLNDGDHIFFPIRKYTTQRLWYKPSTWLRRVITPEVAERFQAAYDANKLKCGGSIKKEKVVSAQNGLSRRKTLDILMNDGGFDRATARLAYQNARNQLRQQTNLRGDELRSIARHNTVRDVLNKTLLDKFRTNESNKK